jgi:carbon-monoxide dehydrogenase medium subunit
MVTIEGVVCKEARIVLGAVAPVPMRALNAEAFLAEKVWSQELLRDAARISSEESRPISDVRASLQYRRKMVAVLTVRALEEAHGRATIS